MPGHWRVPVAAPPASPLHPGFPIRPDLFFRSPAAGVPVHPVQKRRQNHFCSTHVTFCVHVVHLYVLTDI